MKILLVEDKPKMAQLLERALIREGHNVTVAFDGEQALAYGRTGNCDVIVLDLMIPRLDGFAVIRTLRKERHDTPTIIVSARDAMEDIVRGLDLGADDYLTKPFALDILLARIRAVSRRGQGATPVDLRVGELILDNRTHELRRGQRTAPLTRTEYALLEVLMRRAGSIVPRDALVEAGWGLDAEVNDSTLYVFIRMLRAKIALDGERQYLHTARGIGYTMRDDRA